MSGPRPAIPRDGGGGEDPVRTLADAWIGKADDGGGRLIRVRPGVPDPGDETGILEKGTRGLTVLNRVPYTAGH
jgi:hypothetical protein